MNPDELPKPVGEIVLPPAPLTPRQEELCARLDSLHALYDLPVSPSDMFRGAIFASRPECRNNPDWLAQTGNSLREVLYPFYSRQVEGIPTDKKEILEKFGSVKVDDEIIRRMGVVYGKVEGIAHHGNVKKNGVDYVTFSPDDFTALLSEFEQVILDSLTRQVDVHADFDTIVNAGPPAETTHV